MKQVGGRLVQDDLGFFGTFPVNESTTYAIVERIWGSGLGGSDWPRRAFTWEVDLASLNVAQHCEPL